MAVAHTEPAARSKAVPKDALEYRLIFALSFVLFLAAAALERLTPWFWLNRQSRRPLPIIEKARNAAGICATYAFMG